MNRDANKRHRSYHHDVRHSRWKLHRSAPGDNKFLALETGRAAPAHDPSESGQGVRHGQVLQNRSRDPHKIWVFFASHKAICVAGEARPARRTSAVSVAQYRQQQNEELWNARRLLSPARLQAWQAVGTYANGMICLSTPAAKFAGVPPSG